MKKRAIDGKVVIHGYYIDVEHFNKSQKLMATGCHNWTAAKHRQGYGFVFSNDISNNLKSKMLTAHRVAMMIKEDRPLLRSEMVLHTCGNMACVNPAHLEIGDKSRMIEIMKKNGRTNSSKSHDKQIKRQNRKYKYSVQQLFQVRKCHTAHEVAKLLNIGLRAAYDIMDKADAKSNKGYKWLDQFNEDGTLKKEYEELYK